MRLVLIYSLIAIGAILAAGNSIPSSNRIADESAYCAGVYYTLADRVAGDSDAAKHSKLSAQALQLMAISIDTDNSIRHLNKIKKVQEQMAIFEQLGLRTPLTSSHLACNFFKNRLYEVATYRITVEDYYEKYGVISQYIMEEQYEPR